MNDLVKAWKLRKFCPILYFSSNISEASTKPVFDYKEWSEIKGIPNSPAADKLFKHYHFQGNRQRYDNIIEIETNKLFSVDDIIRLQKKIMRFLYKRKIVIETLPTSNVRISNNKDYSTYHLWNWLKWEKGNKIPNIVVGTDDTGIFATNIYNEYAHIYCEYIKMDGKKEADGLSLINRLEKNGRKFRFE